MKAAANLSNKGISAVFWGSFGSLLTALLQISTQIILARILGPAEYGLFALGAIVLTFSNFFSDIGISYGLIQKKTVSDEDIKFVFTWQLILGTAVAIVVFFLADVLADFFREPRMVQVIHVMSVICLLSALSSIPGNLLKRNLDFKSIQMSHLASYACAYIVVAIPLALMGQQVWALVAAYVTNALLNLLFLYNRSRHPIGLRLHEDEQSRLISYGAKVFGTNFVNWITGNIDRVLVGRLFSPAETGLYSVSYNLVYGPATTGIGVIQSALFSTSARAQDDFDRLRKAFLMMSGAMTLFAFPIFFGMAAASETILQSLYGDSWHGATELFRPIAMAMPWYMLLGISTPLLWVSGQTHKELVIQIPVAISFALAVYTAANFSLTAVAWVVFGMYFVRSTIIMVATCSALKINLMEVARSMLGGMAATAVTTSAITLVDMAARRVTDMPSLWLLADVLAGALALAFSLWAFPNLINRHVAQLIERVASRLPSHLGARIQVFINRGELRGQFK